jgi:hypothetical protein
MSHPPVHAIRTRLIYQVHPRHTKPAPCLASSVFAGRRVAESQNHTGSGPGGSGTLGSSRHLHAYWPTALILTETSGGIPGDSETKTPRTGETSL